MTFERVDEALSLSLSVDEVEWYMLDSLGVDSESEVVMLFSSESMSVFDGFGCGIACRTSLF